MVDCCNSSIELKISTKAADNWQMIWKREGLHFEGRKQILSFPTTIWMCHDHARSVLVDTKKVTRYAGHIIPNATTHSTAGALKNGYYGMMHAHAADTIIWHRATTVSTETRKPATHTTREESNLVDSETMTQSPFLIVSEFLIWWDKVQDTIIATLKK